MDYVGNKAHAQLLAKRLEAYYHAKGYTWVIAEVIPRTLSNSQGDRVGVHYDIRSNIKFNVKDIV